MKKFAYLIFLTLLFLLSFFLLGCKKDTTSVQPEQTMEELTNQHLIGNEFTKNIKSAGIDSAIERTFRWAEKQSFVKSVSRLSNGIHIEYKSGFKGAVVSYELDSKGETNIKGGRINPDERHYNNSMKINKDIKKIRKRILRLSKTSSEAIGNKKVLIWAPFESEFKVDMRPSLEEIIKKAGVKLELTTLTNEACTVKSFESITDYGLVIIDSHGNSGKYISTNEKVTNQNRAEYQQWINNSDIEIWTKYILDSTGTVTNSYDKYVISDVFIYDLKKGFPESVIFNGSCESTKSGLLEFAFVDKGAKTYFGFDKTVSTSFCSSMADGIIWQLSDLYSTTGEAFTSGQLDPITPYAEFQMKGSSEMCYQISHWRGYFRYRKNIDKQFVDGDETRKYNLQVKVDLNLILLNPDDPVFPNPYLFKQDSISGPYEITYREEKTNPTFHDVCTSKFTGMTQVNYPASAWIDLSEDSTYDLHIIFRIAEEITMNCIYGNGSLGYFDFYGHPGNWRPDILYPFKGTITNGVISGSWVGPSVVEEQDIYLNGLEGTSFEWNLQKRE